MRQRTTLPDDAGLVPPFAQSSLSGSIDSATLDLLAKWRVEDETQDPEEIRAAEIELAEFKKVLNENRVQSGEPDLYP